MSVILYPQLAIGLFSFGLQRSLPPNITLKKIFPNKRFLFLFSLFIIFSCTFLFILENIFEKPVYNSSYLFPLCSLSSTILVLSVLSNGREFLYNVLRLLYPIFLFFCVLNITNVIDIMFSMVILNILLIVVVLICLIFIPIKEKVCNDLSFKLSGWSVVTSISSNYLLIAGDIILTYSELAILSINLSYYKLLNLYSSAKNLKNFLFYEGVYKKKISDILFLILLISILFIASPYLVRFFYGALYINQQISIFCSLSVLIHTINEYFAQTIYKDGNLKYDFLSKGVLLLLFLLIYSFKLSNIILFFISFILSELVRSILYYNYYKERC